MIRILLVHWNVEEGKKKAASLGDAAYRVELLSRADLTDLRSISETPPDAFLIDLSRLPVQGVSVAAWFRRRKSTRSVPSIFVGGEPEKVERARTSLPDAVYTEWNRVRRDVRSAIRKPARSPVVPGIMDGYSGTPLPKKLGIRPDSGVVLLGAPSGFEHKLMPLPDGARFIDASDDRSNVIILFVKSLAEIRRRLPAAAKRVGRGSRLWIAWPKKASGSKTDLTENDVRALGLQHGLVDYKICAIDKTWSGLCFARRRK